MVVSASHCRPPALIWALYPASLAGKLTVTCPTPALISVPVRLSLLRSRLLSPTPLSIVRLMGTVGLSVTSQRSLASALRSLNNPKFQLVSLFLLKGNGLVFVAVAAEADRASVRHIGIEQSVCIAT